MGSVGFGMLLLLRGNFLVEIKSYRFVNELFISCDSQGHCYGNKGFFSIQFVVKRQPFCFMGFSMLSFSQVNTLALNVLLDT